MGVTDMMEIGLIPTHTSSVSSVKIVDPDLDSLDEMKNEVALETDVKILNQRLDFFGICSNCMAEKV
jgi:Fur family peroxide stress response transcriptional regulator